MSYWWEIKDDTVHNLLYEHVRNIEEVQQGIYAQDVLSSRLYTNRDFPDLRWENAQVDVSYSVRNLTEENHTASAIDALTAKLGKMRVKPVVTVRNTTWDIQREARKLQAYLWAKFKELHVFNKVERMFNDSLWASIGALKIGIKNNKLFLERVLPTEIIVDQRECRESLVPLQVNQRKRISTHALKRQFPDKAEEIETLGHSRKWTAFRTPGIDEQVIIESWFIGKNGEEPRHVICSENITFLNEKWGFDSFPFVFLRWKKLPMGFYGKSFVEEVTALQAKGNKVEESISASQEAMLVPRIFIEANSGVKVSKITNVPGNFLFYNNTLPTVTNWPAVSPELYRERDRIRERILAKAAISPDFSEGTTPKGVRLDSSLAQREQTIKEDKRLAPQAQEIEMAYIDIAIKIVEFSSKLRKKSGEKWDSSDFHSRIDWDAVNLNKNKFTLELQAASVNNMTPAARQDILAQWQAQGRINIDTMNSLSGNPDLEREEMIMSSDKDDIKAVIDELDEGESPIPTKLQNLIYGIPYIHKTYLVRSRIEGIPEEILDNYRHWLAEAKALLQDDQQQQQQDLAPNTLGPKGNVVPSIATTDLGTLTV